ncbi:MAG: hypothetical protein RhofKO_20750 [Rhodothermales bacterium]
MLRFCYVLAVSAVLFTTPLLAQTTARTNLTTVGETVRADYPDAALLGMAATGVNAEGQATAWLYLYATPNGTLAGVFRADDAIFSQAVNLDALGLNSEAISEMVPLMPLGDAWLDSDGALVAVDNAGGAAFRANEPNIWTSMLLLDLPAELILGVDLPGLDQLGPYWLTAHTALPSFQTKLYATESQSGFTLAFDAQRPGGVPASLAEEADDFASDAVLVGVNTVLPDLSQAGTSLLWQYTYYSAQRGEARAFMLGPGDRVVLQMEVDRPEPLEALPTAHITAQEAWDAVAFMPENAVAGPFVQARLGFIDGEATWTFDVFGLDTETGVATQTFHVDATTGQPVRTSIDADILPTTLTLEANYPNPFNPSTTIGFSLPQTAPVRLVVYDLLGRPVQTLVDDTINAGTHEVVFEATDLPSGSYLYRLETNGQTSTRLLTLLK